jgi:hypothetical protein
MDVQAPTIGSAPPASKREEHFADTAPISPRKTPEQRTTGRARQTCPSHRRGRVGIRGDADAELIGDLPTTLQASESDGGVSTKLTFERIIVWPDGHKEIQGVTPNHVPSFPCASQFGFERRKAQRYQRTRGLDQLSMRQEIA